MTKYETVVGFEETGRIQFFGYPKVHSAPFNIVNGNEKSSTFETLIFINLSF